MKSKSHNIPPALVALYARIEEMPFDPGWLVNHQCSSFTGQDGTMYVVRSQSKGYAHAHPLIASYLCGEEIPFDAAHRGPLVVNALAAGYLRVAVLPTIIGVNADVGSIEEHRERIIALHDLASPKIFRAEITRGSGLLSADSMDYVWRWEESPERPAPKSFDIEFRRVRHATL